MANEVTNFNIGGVDHAVQDVGARQLIAELQIAINAITSGDTTTAIKTFQEVIDFLDGVTDDATLIGKLNELRILINGKVDNVQNKGLSTEDYTTEDKQKLAGLSNYDDTGIQNAINHIQNTIDALTGKEDTTAAINTMNEVTAFLAGLTNSDTLTAKLAELRALIAAKYSKPTSGIPASDLANGVIPDVSGFATKTEVNAKANSADVYNKSEVDTKVANAGKVKSVSVNNGTPSQPDAQGNVNLTVAAGADTDIVGISVPSPYDGTVVFTKRNGDTVTVNLNHTHPQYLKYELLADEAAYEAIATKDSSTLYLITEE